MANNYGSNGFIKTETFYENGNIESVNVEYSDKTRNLRKYSNSGILIFESWERPDGSSEVCKYDNEGNLIDKIRTSKNVESCSSQKENKNNDKILQIQKVLSIFVGTMFNNHVDYEDIEEKARDIFKVLNPDDSLTIEEIVECCKLEYKTYRGETKKMFYIELIRLYFWKSFDFFEYLDNHNLEFENTHDDAEEILYHLKKCIEENK